VEARLQIELQAPSKEVEASRADRPARQQGRRPTVGEQGEQQGRRRRTGREQQGRRGKQQGGVGPAVGTMEEAEQLQERGTREEETARRAAAREAEQMRSTRLVRPQHRRREKANGEGNLVFSPCMETLLDIWLMWHATVDSHVR
jgi:hypothetical protein